MCVLIVDVHFFSNFLIVKIGEVLNIDEQYFFLKDVLGNVLICENCQTSELKLKIEVLLAVL